MNNQQADIVIDELKRIGDYLEVIAAAALVSQPREP